MFQKNIYYVSALPRTLSIVEELQEVDYITLPPHFLPESGWWKTLDYTNVWTEISISIVKTITFFWLILTSFC